MILFGKAILADQQFGLAVRMDTDSPARDWQRLEERSESVLGNLGAIRKR
jgi:hypothetical protein